MNVLKRKKENNNKRMKEKINFFFQKENIKMSFEHEYRVKTHLVNVDW